MTDATSDATDDATGHAPETDLIGRGAGVPHQRVQHEGRAQSEPDEGHDEQHDRDAALCPRRRLPAVRRRRDAGSGAVWWQRLCLQQRLPAAPQFVRDGCVKDEHDGEREETVGGELDVRIVRLHEHVRRVVRAARGSTRGLRVEMDGPEHVRVGHESEAEQRGAQVRGSPRRAVPRHLVRNKEIK